MGCDIHLSVEKYNDKTKKWEFVPGNFEPCFGCEGTGKNPKRTEAEIDDDGTKIKAGDCYWCRGEGKRREDFYHGRNYDVFAILADVRNGRGFAGVKTGDGFNIISEPRGVPKDASPEYLKRVEEYGVDGHSHSYHTIADLDAFDWGQKSTHQGVVSPFYYKQWKEGGGTKAPAYYCGGIGGPNVVQVTNDVMDELIANGTIVFTSEEVQPFGDGPAKSKDGNSYFTSVRWTELYHESTSNFLEAMKKVRELGPPDKVRIVFFFDN